ncbi:MAG: DNA primase [Piscirickettsiaceae bacterium]|nr:MAG: DNA primase [Piscirickettsiaceae bacterium]
MAGRIPQHFIDDLLARTDIVALIDALVPLKKKGANYSACCPFHNEKTPSFTVSQDKQFYHCFGCGANGSAIGFLMDFSHLDFVEAIEDLASMAGVEVVREGDGQQAPPKKQLTHLYDLNEKVNHFYQQLLRKPESSIAVSYLKRRGLSGQIARLFQIGYVPTGWSHVLDKFGETASQRTLLQELGLIVSNDNNKTYDRFRERIIFPIRNKKGQTVGFGGRVLDQGEPKYLNSPETPLYHKGREVYGLYEALQAVNKIQRLVLVEGYLDVVALHEYGMPNAVAALGTAITKEQIELLFRSAPEVVICMDGDSAGQKAAWRAMVNALPVLRSGRQMKILLLPTGEDPDTLIRAEGAEAFSQRVINAVPLSDYFFDELSKKYALSTLEGRAIYLEQAKPLLDSVPDGVFSSMMFQKLSDLTKVERLSNTKVSPKMKRPLRADKKPPSVIRHVITSIIHQPELAKKLSTEELWLSADVPGMSVLKKLMGIVSASPELTTAMLLERYRGAEDEKIIQSLFQEERLMSSEQSSAEFSGAVQRLIQQSSEQRLSALLEKSRSSKLSSSELEELTELYKINS